MSRSGEATSRYDGDPRVSVHENPSDGDGPGYTVQVGGHTFHVLHTKDHAWVICEGPNLEFVQDGAGGFAIGISSADDAIGALIGEPED